jgi:hypothetical protein
VGCASAPPLTDRGAKVREITAATKAQCRFLQVVQFSTRLYGLGKDPAIMHTTGENGIRSEVAAHGGNAVVVTHAESDWFLGNVAYTGEAYECPGP